VGRGGIFLLVFFKGVSEKNGFLLMVFGGWFAEKRVGSVVIGWLFFGVGKFGRFFGFILNVPWGREGVPQRLKPRS
jgi:hypothetical protein